MGRDPSRTAPEPRPARRRFVAALVVLGSIVGLAANLVSWVEGTLLDTDTWVETVEPLPSDPAVSKALSTFLVDELFRTVALEDQIRSALPEQAAFLAGPLTSTLRSYAVDVADDMLRSEQFAEAWVRANRAAHGLLVKALEGGGENVAVQDGQVVVDLRPAVRSLAERLDVDLEGLLERVEVPEDAGRFTVMESEQLGSIQDAVAMLHTLGWFVPVAAVALWVLAVVLAPDRRRTVLGIGIGLVTITLGTGLVLDLARSRTLDRIADPVNADAAESFWEITLRGFTSQNRALFAFGLVLVLGAYLVGPGRAAVWVRGRARRGTDTLDEQLGEQPGWLVVLTGFARGHRDVLVPGVVIAGIVALVLWDHPSARVVLAVAGIVLLLVVLVSVGSALSAGAMSSGAAGQLAEADEQHLDEV